MGLDTKLTKEDIIPPEGYYVEETHKMLLLTKNDKTEQTRLTDRTFGDVDYNARKTEPTDIDYWTGHAISRSIENMLKRRKVARVLDIGCGPLNRAAYDIATRYGERVDVTAVDIIDCKKRLEAPNLKRHIASATDLPFDPYSFDVAYSFQLITWMPIDQRAQTFKETLRVMSRDSHSVLDAVCDSREYNSWLLEYARNGFFMLPLLFEHEGNGVAVRSIMEAPDAAPGKVYIGCQPKPHLHVRKAKDMTSLLSKFSPDFF